MINFVMIFIDLSWFSLSHCFFWIHLCLVTHNHTVVRCDVLDDACKERSSGDSYLCILQYIIDRLFEKKSGQFLMGVVVSEVKPFLGFHSGLTSKENLKLKPLIDIIPTNGAKIYFLLELLSANN